MAPLVVETGRSRALGGAVAACYCAAAALWVALPHGWAAAGASVALLCCIRELAGLRRARTLVWHAGGDWSVGVGTGRADGLRLAASTFVSRGLVVVGLRDQAGRTRRYVLARDGVDRGSWRRLQARLRIEGASLAAPDGGWKSLRGEP